MSRWFYAKGKQKTGPVTIDELKALLRSGQLQPSDMLLQEGSQKWVAASDVKELFVNSIPVAQHAPTSANTSASKIPPKALVIGAAAAGAFLLLCCGTYGIINILGDRSGKATNAEKVRIDGEKKQLAEAKKEEKGTNPPQGENGQPKEMPQPKEKEIEKPVPQPKEKEIEKPAKKTELPLGRKLDTRLSPVGDKPPVPPQFGQCISNVRTHATDNAIIIEFDSPQKWFRGSTTHLLVRLFDKDGKYLTHFQSREVFTCYPDIAMFTNAAYDQSKRFHDLGRTGQTPESDRIYKHVAITYKNNRLVYPVNAKALRETAIVEIGFRMPLE